MQRALYAILVSIALLMQGATATLAFDSAAHKTGACAGGQRGYTVAKTERDVDQSRNHSRRCSHCDWCLTGAAMTATKSTEVAVVAKFFIDQPIHEAVFEHLTNSREDPNAPPTAPPTLS